MKRLKIVLQSNYFYLLLFILLIIYILISTVLIRYKSNIKTNYYEGIITNISIKNDKVSFIIKGKEKIKGTYYIKNNDINYYDYLGCYVRITGKKIELNNNTIPNNFNYKNYLYNNHIYTSYSIDNIELLKESNIFYKIKTNIYLRIDNYKEDIKPYLNIFILGDKSLLDNDTYNIFKENGICHLFSISGMHISLLLLVLSKLLNKIKYHKIIISIFLLYFMFLTSFSPSVERVCVFYYLKNIFEHFNIDISNIKILLLTAFICIIIDPFIMYNTGFQYSFIITLGIMLESKRITGNYFIKILKISLISFIISLPITINLNYEINLLSVILNIIYVPFISLIIFPLIIVTYVFEWISPLLSILIYVLEVTNNFFNNINISLIIPKMSYILIIIYYLILHLVYRFNNKKHLLGLIFIILVNILVYKMDSGYEITMFDVSQGDSILIITPHKKNITLIDTGGMVNNNYYISNNYILYMKSIGINKINTLIVTHGDYDHMGEAINLVNNFRVEKVIFNCGPHNDLEQELIKVLDKKKIKYYSCIKELNIGNNKLYFLQTKEYDNENDNSNVIYTELDGYKFMFMGDASINTEKEILSKYNLPDIDVLKVGHHGSKTSSSKEFVNEINPRYSVISVGKNNSYGHPNKEVLNSLQSSIIYRTDQDGSVMFKIKNNKLKIETCSP